MPVSDGNSPVCSFVSFKDICQQSEPTIQFVVSPDSAGGVSFEINLALNITYGLCFNIEHMYSSTSRIDNPNSFSVNLKKVDAQV